MILRLGSQSSTEPWIPLLGLPNYDQSEIAANDPDLPQMAPEIDWGVKRKCIYVMVFLVRTFTVATNLIII
jgi:hypothetical protein